MEILLIVVQDSTLSELDASCERMAFVRTP